MDTSGQRTKSEVDEVISRLQTALQAVRDPETYLHTADTVLPSHRAALAERAKALTGLMLFEIEGLIRAHARFREKGICDVPSVVHNAWLRWLQLHGRQAGVVVPMDGWLITAFPRELLTADEIVLDTLGNSSRLGGTEQANSELQLPAAMLVPCHLFGELVGDPDLGARIAKLLSTESLPFGELGSRSVNSASEFPVTARLIEDFAEMIGIGLPANSNYPAH